MRSHAAACSSALIHSSPPPQLQSSKSPPEYSSRQLYSLQRQPSENKVEYKKWHGYGPTKQQLKYQQRMAKRPKYIWAIGVIDILVAFWYTGSEVYNALVNSSSLYLDDYILGFFLGFLGIFVRLLMGSCLLLGLSSEDDANTLLYCKIWMTCQLIFVASSCFEITSVGLSFVLANMQQKGKMMPVILATMWIFGFRLASLAMMIYFVANLKKREMADQIHLAGVDGSRFARPESSFSVPSAALISPQ